MDGKGRSSARDNLGDRKTGGNKIIAETFDGCELTIASGGTFDQIGLVEMTIIGMQSAGFQIWRIGRGPVEGGCFGPWRNSGSVHAGIKIDEDLQSRFCSGTGLREGLEGGRVIGEG